MDTDEVPAWTIEETQKLTAPWLQKRTRYAADPAQFAEEHRRAGCRVWIAGVGTVVPGFVVPPSQVLVEKEGENVVGVVAPGSPHWDVCCLHR